MAVKNKKKGKKANRGDAGILPTNHPRFSRWRIDIDYADQLSHEHRVWLARFLDAHVGGCFTGQKRQWPKELRRDIWTGHNRERLDATTLAGLSAGGLEELSPYSTDPTEKDWSESPSYLSEPDYKEAVAELRRHTPKHLSRNPVLTPELLRAMRRLQIITPAAPYSEEDDNDA